MTNSIHGEIDFIFIKSFDEDEEANGCEEEKEEEINFEERLEVLQCFCNAVNKATEHASYKLVLPNVELSQFNENGDVCCLKFSGKGEGTLEENIEMFELNGLIDEELKKAGIFKKFQRDKRFDIEIMMKFDEAVFKKTHGREWIYPNSGANIYYGVEDEEIYVKCYKGIEEILSYYTLDKYNFNDELKELIQSILESIKEDFAIIEYKIFNYNYDIYDDIIKIKRKL